MKKIITVLGIIAFVSTAIAYSFLNYYIDTELIFAEEKDRHVTYQVNFVSSYPNEIDGRYFVKKGSDWFLYSQLQNNPYWLDVGTLDHKDGAIFKQIPDITHLAIQFWTEGDIEIVNVTGDGNFTTNFDIDGDKKNDFVFLKEVNWDDSEPKLDFEYRTNSIFGKVEVKQLRTPMDKMKMDIETIILIEKNHPDLLTDEETDILLSYTIGKGYGYVDPEVDAKVAEIMFKILEEGILE